jgi:hypothetical protein
VKTSSVSLSMYVLSQVPHPYKTTDEIIVLHVLTCRVLDGRSNIYETWATAVHPQFFLSDSVAKVRVSGSRVHDGKARRH